MKPTFFIFLLTLFGMSLFNVFFAFPKGIIHFIISIFGMMIFLFLLIVYAKRNQFRFRRTN